MALKGFGNDIQSSKEVFSKNLLYKQKILGVASVAACGCGHVHGHTFQKIFSCSICMHLQTAQT